MANIVDVWYVTADNMSMNEFLDIEAFGSSVVPAAWQNDW
jgi:hypothetical protein